MTNKALKLKLKSFTIPPDNKIRVHSGQFWAFWTKR